MDVFICLYNNEKNTFNPLKNGFNTNGILFKNLSNHKHTNCKRGFSNEIFMNSSKTPNKNKRVFYFFREKTEFFKNQLG